MSSVVLLFFFIAAKGSITPTKIDETGAYFITSQINEYQYGDLHCNHSKLCSVQCLYQNSCSSTKITIKSARFILKCSAIESCSSIQLIDIATNTSSIACTGTSSCAGATMDLDLTFGAIDIECRSTESCRSTKVYTGTYSDAINVSCTGESSCQFSNWYLSYTEFIHFDCIHGGGLGSSACWNIALHAEYCEHVYLWCDDNMDCISSQLFCPTKSENICHVTCNKEYACRTFTVLADDDYTANYLDIVEYENNALNVVSVSCYDAYLTDISSTLLLSISDRNYSIACECSSCCPFDDDAYYHDDDEECKDNTDSDDDIYVDDVDSASTVGIVLGSVFGSFFVIFVIVIICSKISRRETRGNMQSVTVLKPQSIQRTQRVPPIQNVVQPGAQPVVQYYQPQAQQNYPVVHNVVTNVPYQQQGGVVMVQLQNGQMVAAQLMDANQEVQPQNEGVSNYTVQ